MSKINIVHTGIVGLSGYATSGKDLLCEKLKERGGNVKRFALADKLKESLSPFILNEYGVDIYKATPKEKELLRPLMVAYSKLHRYRTKGRFFSEKIEKEVIEHSKNGLAVITDVRFAEFVGTDELWWLSDLGGVLVNVEKYHIKDNKIEVVGPPNQEEAENGPKLKNAADYLIKWPQQEGRLDYLDRYVDNLTDYLNGLLPIKNASSVENRLRINNQS
jgi:hypothetical protein